MGYCRSAEQARDAQRVAYGSEQGNGRLLPQAKDTVMERGMQQQRREMRVRRDAEYYPCDGRKQRRRQRQQGAPRGVEQQRGTQQQQRDDNEAECPQPGGYETIPAGSRNSAYRRGR